MGEMSVKAKAAMFQWKISGKLDKSKNLKSIFSCFPLFSKSFQGFKNRFVLFPV